MTATLRMSMVASVAFVALVGSAQAQQAPQSPNMTFFITSVGSGKGADLGGLAGADAHCQQLADRGRRRQQDLARLSEHQRRATKAARSTPAIASARAPGRTSRAR